MSGLERDYRAAMQLPHKHLLKSRLFFRRLHPYVVPNAFRRRVLLEFNLRSGMHMLALRSAPNAHFSMRRAARRMIEEINQAQPHLGRYFPVDSNETWRSIESAFFAEA